LPHIDKAMGLVRKILQILVHSPFYPYWLVNLKSDHANKELLPYIKGKVLEVGSGDGKNKDRIVRNNQKVKRYIASDITDWKGEFIAIDSLIKKNSFNEIFIGYQTRVKPDCYCDALSLPFRKDTFDTHISFEVLEHIGDPFQYFCEATRVVKKGGRIIIAVPYLFRMHGQEPDHKLDYYRFSFGFFYKIAKDRGLKVEHIICNTGMGTTVSLLINQWFTRHMIETGKISRIFYFIIAIVLFPLTNIFGYLFDITPDIRFATRFYVIYKKI